MFFAGELLCLNIISLFFAVILSWYFGGYDFHLHPDRLIASLVSYCEKSTLRSGSAREGTTALILILAAVFSISSLLFYFIRNAGSFWYFIFSLLVFYWIINPRFTRAQSDRNLAVNYMNYAFPVIFYSFLFGPVGGLMYRTLPIAAHMNPVTIDRYRDFGSAYEKTFSVFTDAALLLVPVLVEAAGVFRKTVRFIKSFRP